MKSKLAFGLVVAALLAVAYGPAHAQSKGRIAFSQSNFGNEWWETQAKGAEVEIKKLGYDRTVISAQGDPVTQNSQVRTFITQRFNAVMLNPTAPEWLEPSIIALKRAHIPLVTVNSPLLDALLKDVYCYVSDDQQKNAATVGAEMGS